MVDAPELKKIQKNTVQDLPDAVKEGTGLSMFYVSQRGYNLPPWGTRERERSLRLFYRNEYNWMGQSAFAGLIKKVKSASWEISGKKRVRQFQDVLRQAHFGAGWGDFLSRVILDYLRQDCGAYIELIAPGNPMKPPTGPVVGIAHLDSLRCYPTGDPAYPVIYYSRKGKMHLMHRSRVAHLVDMPDGDESRPGYGMCALSRAISIVNQQIHANRYIEAKLDDKPPPGYMVASNITSGHRQQAFEQFRQEQSNDERPFWGRTVWLYGVDPAQPVKLEQVAFQQAPEGWSYKEYTELHVNAWAFALGVDVQELWQLTGGSLGSGQQSQILHAKSQGKTFGDLLTSLERVLNDVLPESLEFAFKRHDPYEAQERADTAGKWSTFTSAVKEESTPDERRRILANMVEAFKDAVTDENGEIVRLTDIDTQPEGEETAEDDTPLPEAQSNPAPATDEDQAAGDEKAIQSTRLDFETEFEDILTEARAKTIDRRRFGILLRSIVRKYGREAYRDGLVEGGIEDGEITADDEPRITALTAEASGYISGLADEVYKEGGVSDGQAVMRPAMWYNKSISPFFDAGRLAADRNGYYIWNLGATEEHCTDCLYYDTQIHRLRDWSKRDLIPPTDKTECKGFQCKCNIKKTDGKARGKFRRAA
jgi:hypothetical protein